MAQPDPSLFVDLVRSPTSLLERPLATVAPPLLLATAVGGAMYGAAIGAHHSALQALNAAVKLPLVLLVPPLVAVPAVRALAEAFQLTLPPRRAAVAGLVCVARIALFAAALSPIVWVLSNLGGYEWAVAWATLTLGIAGLPGTFALGSAPSGDAPIRRLGVVVGACAIFGSVAAQTAWLLRPFILRDELPVAFLEVPESDVFSALAERAVLAPPADVPAPAVPPSAAGQLRPDSERARLEAIGYLQ
jgi:hypothetical protein